MGSLLGVAAFVMMHIGLLHSEMMHVELLICMQGKNIARI